MLGQKHSVVGGDRFELLESNFFAVDYTYMSQSITLKKEIETERLACHSKMVMVYYTKVLVSSLEGLSGTKYNKNGEQKMGGHTITYLINSDTGQ